MKSSSFATTVKANLRAALGPLLPLVRSLRTLPALIRAKNAAAALHPVKGISICYLTDHFPIRPALRTEIAHGGAVKLTFLNEFFPHSYPDASLLYTVSSVDHTAKIEIIRNAKKNGLKIVLNQNGVAYHAWYGSGWEEPNRKLREAYELADFIIFQSKFCQTSATKFLGTSNTPSQVIYNPVDISLYQPTPKKPGRIGPVLLLGGNQYEQYRFEIAVQTLKYLTTYLPNAYLLITGKLWGENQQASMEIAKDSIRRSGLETQVEFTGSYSQESAAKIFQRADILLHTKYNDPSPNLIAEALACGLPIVYSASGGVPELVGPDAGIGIPVEHSWEKIYSPNLDLMAQAIVKIWGNHARFGEAARQQAVDQFPMAKFVRIHRDLFAKLTD